MKRRPTAAAQFPDSDSRCFSATYPHATVFCSLRDLRCLSNISLGELSRRRGSCKHNGKGRHRRSCAFAGRQRRLGLWGFLPFMINNIPRPLDTLLSLHCYYIDLEHIVSFNRTRLLLLFTPTCSIPSSLAGLSSSNLSRNWYMVYQSYKLLQSRRL